MWGCRLMRAKPTNVAEVNTHTPHATATIIRSKRSARQSSYRGWQVQESERNETRQKTEKKLEVKKMKNENRLSTIEAIVVAIATLGGWTMWNTADNAHKALRNAGHAVSRNLVREAWKARTVTATVVKTLNDAVEVEPTTVQPPRTIEGGKTRKSGRTTMSDEELVSHLADLKANHGITSALKALRHMRSNGKAASQARVHSAWKTVQSTDEEE